MIRRLAPLFLLLPAATLTLGAWGLKEGSDVTKRALVHDDYDSWRSIAQPGISSDGRWLLYAETPQDGEAELVVKNIDDGRVYRHTIGYSGEGTDSERAFRGQFTYDNTHVLFLISPSQEEVKKAKKKRRNRGRTAGSEPPSDQRPGERGDADRNRDDGPKKSLGILDLTSGQVSTIARVRSFQLPEKAGGWVAYHMEPPPRRRESDKESEEPGNDQRRGPRGRSASDSNRGNPRIDDGSDLVLRSLSDGTHTPFKHVTEYRLGRQAKRLYYIVKSKDVPEKDGLYLQRTSGGDPQALLQGEGKYSALSLNKEQTRLALMVERTEGEDDVKVTSIFGGRPDSQPELWVTTSSDGIPAGLVVRDDARLRFSEDGKVLLFGIGEPRDDKDEEAGEEGEAEDSDDEAEPEPDPEARFDLWHWDDPYPQPQQKQMAKQVRDNTFETLYYPESGRIVQLADAQLPDVTLSDDGRTAWAQNPWPYTREVSYDGRYADIWTVNTETGERTKVVERLPGRPSLSPTGRYLSWFAEGHWFVYDRQEQATVNLTEELEPSFAREDHDTPNAAGGYGSAGWTDNDLAILIYDRFDIWAFSPDGSESRMITEGVGRASTIAFRYLRLDPEADSIDPAKPLLLRAVNETTRAEGFYRDHVSGDSKPEKLIMADASFGFVAKAKDADRILLTKQSFAEYPDLWLSSVSFDEPKRLTELGRQTESFIWGRAELRDFLSSDGLPLKGILIKPDNYDVSRQYPLMVYIYETLNNNLHRFRNPSPGSSVNPSYYVSNGYVLWMPDIEYTTGYPGRDALKCVLPGINMLIAEGLADRDNIGIQGHSWGGYQIAYMVTQTNIFKAAEAGAPVSNMVSAYGGIRWQSGMVRQFQYERTQSRLGASLWEVPMRYIENSPIFWLDKVETPLLVLHNDEDGAVPWYQGIELIMGLRRLQREAYMFNYNGEAHGLRRRVNQQDWTIRMAEFFDHHLKGAPKPEWMEKGIQAWEKDPPTRP